MDNTAAINGVIVGNIKDDKYVYTFSKGKKLQGKVVVTPPIPITKNGYEEEDNRPI